MNSNLCSRFQKQENVKAVLVETGANVKLEHGLVDEYLYNNVEWFKDQIPINSNPNFNNNIFLTSFKGTNLKKVIFCL